MWVAKQMGHRDWTMIARVYGRWMPAMGNNAGSKAESVFSGLFGRGIEIQTNDLVIREGG